MLIVIRNTRFEYVTVTLNIDGSFLPFEGLSQPPFSSPLDCYKHIKFLSFRQDFSFFKSIYVHLSAYMRLYQRPLNTVPHLKFICFKKYAVFFSIELQFNSFKLQHFTASAPGTFH